MRRLNIEDLKKEYIGKTINWLTVIDIFRDEHSIIIFKCQCKCGSIIDVRKQYVLSGHTRSCGCYKKSKEKSVKYTEWCKNNPDKVKERSEKYSKWCKNNPDKVKESSIKRSKTLKENPDILVIASKKQQQFWKDNPDKLAERGRRRSKWAKENPDKVKEIAHKCSQFWEDNPDKKNDLSDKISSYYEAHPEIVAYLVDRLNQWRNDNHEIVADIGKARSELYKENPELLKNLSIKNKEYWRDHPDELAARSKKQSDYYKNNPDAIHLLSQRNSMISKEKRAQSDFKCLIDIIHPAQIDKLISGDIKSIDRVFTKCPICDNYAEHDLHNVFYITKGQFRLGRPPLCPACRSSLTSSKYEQEISDYISTFYNGELIKNSREIISPFELDLYYPEKKIAVEFNGDYWHSELFKDKDYHYSKFKLCLEHGILLVSIFEHYWLINKEAIMLYLFDTFNNNYNEISFSENRSLMNNNYPNRLCLNSSNEFICDSYIHNNSKVFTCGYTKIK